MLTVCACAVHAADRQDPVGVWNCLVYGDPVRGDFRIALALTADGESFWATQAAGSLSGWARLENWDVRGRAFSFVDPRSRRGYRADLTRNSLGGVWNENGQSGGWWCARRSATVADIADSLSRSSPELFIPPLVPDVMASPSYPLEAIKEAKEGHAVVCFLVDASGAVSDAEILELSDRVFESTTLRAIGRSHYRPSSGVEALRPGCRQFTYELQAKS